MPPRGSSGMTSLALFLTRMMNAAPKNTPARRDASGSPTKAETVLSTFAGSVRPFYHANPCTA